MPQHAHYINEARHHCDMVENAREGITLEREALQADRRLDPQLIAQTIGNYQRSMQEHLQWLNEHGFPASVVDGIVSVHGLDKEATPTQHHD